MVPACAVAPLAAASPVLISPLPVTAPAALIVTPPDAALVALLDEASALPVATVPFTTTSPDVVWMLIAPEAGAATSEVLIVPVIVTVFAFLKSNFPAVVTVPRASMLFPALVRSTAPLLLTVSVPALIGANAPDIAPTPDEPGPVPNDTVPAPPAAPPSLLAAPPSAVIAPPSVSAPAPL